MSTVEYTLEKKKLYFKTHKTSAIITGISLLLMAVIAGIAYGYLHPQIVISGDEIATAQLIKQNSNLFFLEIVLWWIVLLLDIIVSLSLFNFYKDTNPKLSLITMALRLIYSLILGISIIILSTALHSEGNALARIMKFNNVWSIGLIFFGLHLFLLGYTALSNNITPKIVAWLIVMGGLCYTVIHLLKVTIDRFVNISSVIEPYLVMPMALSEIILAIWLIYGAIKISGRKQSSLDPAQ